MQSLRKQYWQVIRIASGAIGLTIALWPAWAAAECGPLDAGGCVDGALYSFWEGLASLGWWIDRTLLMAAFQIDALRWWLVEIAFTSAYAALTAAISPLIAPIATVAIIIGCLFFLLLPIAGRVRVVNIRHALVWALLAPVLLASSGPLIVQLEQVRSEVGTTLAGAVSTLAPGAIFGAAGSDMNIPRALYPANPCGNTLARRTTGGLRLDDLAAALLWADAEDIHCPEVGGPGRDIPDAFYDAAPSGAGYAVDMDVSMMPPGTPRSAAVRGIQRGAVRTFVGILPSILAVLEALVQLLFALSLVALWISLPIGLLFVFFEQNVGTISGLFRRMLMVLQVSWSSSVVIGLLVACLIAAAELRNGAAYSGFAIGGGALVVYVLKVAIDTFVACLRTVSEVVTVVTGLSPAQAAATATTAAGTALSLGAAAATGAATAGLVAAAAYQQTGNTTYAAATLFGRLRPVAELGEVAQTMGVLEADSALASGLYAGQRSERSLRAARLQIHTDAARPDPSGRTLRDQADERRVSSELRRQQRPTIIQEVEGAVEHASQFTRYIGSPHMTADLERLGELTPNLVSANWQRARAQMSDVSSAVMQQAGAGAGPLRIAAATAQVLDAHLHPGGRGQVIQLDARGHVTFTAAPAAPPAHALQVTNAEANIPRLLTLGYAVQERGSQVFVWRVRDEQLPAKPGKRPVASTLQRSRAGTISVNANREAGTTEPADPQIAERTQLMRAGALLAAANTPTLRSTQHSHERVPTPTGLQNEQPTTTTGSASMQRPATEAQQVTQSTQPPAALPPHPAEELPHA